MSPTETNNPGRTRLLVVDDIEVNRKLMARQLEQYGHEVILAESGPEELTLYVL